MSEKEPPTSSTELKEPSVSSNSTDMKDKPSQPPTTGRKRPFPKSRQLNDAKKRSKAKFNEPTTAKQIATTSPIYTAYEIETSFRGLILICDVLYAILTNRDQKISSLMSAEHFQYVTLLSIIYRAQLVASHSTTTIVRNLSYLKETVADLLLPDVLCQYVESIGYARTDFGITVIPYIRDYATMRNSSLDFIDPASILSKLGIVADDTQWAINDSVVLHYKQAISRALKNAVQLRKVNNTELEAKPEFLASYVTLADGKLQPLAFSVMNVNQCQLGAVYMFRNQESIDDWNGLKLPILHETASISPRHYLTDYILHLLKGDN